MSHLAGLTVRCWSDGGACRMLLRATALAICIKAAFTQQIFINEIHYDNVGGDVNEFVEIAAPTGTNLAGYELVFYNGNGGTRYDTASITGTVQGDVGGFGFLAVFRPGIQNGSPDGVALVGPGNVVLQFLSYEGTFVAFGGPANGLASEDIFVAEDGDEPIGTSLSLVGAGTTYDDFLWEKTQVGTPGQVNTGQTFGALGSAPPPPPPAAPPSPSFPPPPTSPPLPVTLISEIQGSGSASPLAGTV
eukprot:3742251-Pleurochrysis_carterae.AAC.2